MPPETKREALKRKASTIAFEAAPIKIHGLRLPNFVFVRSTIAPIIGSFTPSQILARGAKISRKADFMPSTFVR